MPGNSGSEHMRSACRSLTGRLPVAEAEPCVGFGEVDRRRVVHRRGDPAIGQVRAQLVALLAADDEQVVDVVALGARAGGDLDPVLAAVLREALGEPRAQRCAESAGARSFHPSSSASLRRSTAACSASSRAVVPTRRWW